MPRTGHTTLARFQWGYPKESPLSLLLAGPEEPGGQVDCSLCNSLLAPPQSLGEELQLQRRVRGPSVCLLAEVGESVQGGEKVGRQTGAQLLPRVAVLAGTDPTQAGHVLEVARFVPLSACLGMSDQSQRCPSLG